MAHLFISYASADQAIAMEVCALLEARGVACWIAPRDVAAGKVWDEAILDAIEGASAFLLVLSSSANASAFVKNEVNRAFSLDKPIVTFRVEDVTPGRSLELYLARHHWTDGFAGRIEDQVAQLAASVTSLIGALPQSTVGVATQVPAKSGTRAKLATRASRRERLAWSVAAAAAVLFLTAAGFAVRAYVSQGARVAAIPTRTALTLEQPSGTPLVLSTTYIDNTAAGMRLSPDGTRLVFEGDSGIGDYRLWVRRLDTMAAESVAGDAVVHLADAFGIAYSPFWSADGRMIGFFSQRGTLMKVSAAGGTPVLVADTANARFNRRPRGSWSQHDDIVYEEGDGIFRVSAAGGKPVKLLTGRSPSFLPDGDHFLYTLQDGIHVRTLDGKDDHSIGSGPAADPVFATGHIWYWRAGVVYAQLFEMSTLKATGEPVPVADHVDGYTNTSGVPFGGAFTVSTTGTIVFQRATNPGSNQLVWFDRRGGQLMTVGKPGNYNNIELSPDGSRATIGVLDPGARGRDIWTIDLVQSTWNHFTFDSTDERTAAWMPDGSRIVYNSGGSGKYALFAKAASGAGAVETVLTGATDSKDPIDISRDGRFLMFRGSAAGGGGTGNDIWVSPLFSDRKAYPLVATAAGENFARFSPDGSLVAYTSDESGRPEIYVVPFKGSGKWQVSSAGGQYPRWRRDGKELYFMGFDGSLMAASVDAAGGAFTLGQIQRLFQVRATVFYPYSVSPGGDRFLVIEDTAAPIPPTLVTNWQPAPTTK